MASDKDNLKAGWYWLNDNTEWMTRILLTISSSDELQYVRLGALQLLENIDIDFALEPIEDMIEDEDMFVATLALKIYSHRASSPLEKLEELTQHQSWEIAEIAWRETLSIFARRDTQKAVDWILNDTMSRRSSYVDVLDPLWSSDNVDAIKPLIKAKEALTRRKAFEIVKNSLDEEEVENLVEDPDVWLRAAAYMELISRGVAIDEQDVKEKLKDAETTGYNLRTSERIQSVPTYGIEEVLTEMYKRLTRDGLERMVAWTSLDSPLKYEALVTKYFDQLGDIVRKDLSEDFSRIREQFYSTVRQDIGDRAESMLEDWKRLDGFLTSRFRSGAMNALSKHAVSGDIELARDSLRKSSWRYDSGKTALAAFQILQEYGAVEDIELLKEYVAGQDPVLRRHVASSILELTEPNNIDVLEYLLSTDDAEVLRLSLKWLLGRENDLYVNKVKELLYAKADQIRTCALSYLIHVSERNELEVLLDEYPGEQRFYYYNVICWLDRILYAPQELREDYTRQIKERIDEPFDL
jgi:HEAT repeat protein